MIKIDLSVLANQLNSLAELFDKKPVSPKALELWFDTLREFPTERVMDVLNSWAKAHGKFPVPAEVWKCVNESSIKRREVERMEIRQEAENFAYTGPKASESLEKMRAMMRDSHRLSRSEVWEKVLANPKSCSLAKQYANEVFGNGNREPGSDDELGRMILEQADPDFVDKKLQSCGS